MTSHLNTAVIIREGDPDTSQDEGAKFLLKSSINKFLIDRIFNVSIDLCFCLDFRNVLVSRGICPNPYPYFPLNLSCLLFCYFPLH